MKFKKKPVIIEARQLNAQSRKGISKWINRGITGDADNKSGLTAWYYESNGDSELYIQTLEGVMTAADGDWIIKGVKGEFYPCKPDIFSATYERTNECKESTTNIKNQKGAENCTPESWVGTKKACQYLGISMPTIRRWIKDGILNPKRTPMRELRFRLSELNTLIE